MLSHSGGEQGFVGDKRGTFWSLDRHYDFAARSAVIAAIEESRPPGVGLVGLLRRRARSSVKKRVGDSAPVLVIRGGGSRGDDHRGAEHGGRCARGKKSLGDHSSTPPSEKGRGCPDYQCNSSTLQLGGYSKPTLLTLSSVRRKREARRERAECDGRPGPVRPNTAGQGLPVHEMATSLEGNAASVSSDYFHHVQGLSQCSGGGTNGSWSRCSQYESCSRIHSYGGCCGRPRGVSSQVSWRPYGVRSSRSQTSMNGSSPRL
jgi:hypothetical protein